MLNKDGNCPTCLGTYGFENGRKPCLNEACPDNRKARALAKATEIQKAADRCVSQYDGNVIDDKAVIKTALQEIYTLANEIYAELDQ